MVTCLKTTSKKAERICCAGLFQEASWLVLAVRLCWLLHSNTLVLARLGSSGGTGISKMTHAKNLLAHFTFCCYTSVQTPLQKAGGKGLTAGLKHQQPWSQQGWLARTCREKQWDGAGEGATGELGQDSSGTNVLVLGPGNKHSIARPWG